MYAINFKNYTHMYLYIYVNLQSQSAMWLQTLHPRDQRNPYYHIMVYKA